MKCIPYDAIMGMRRQTNHPVHRIIMDGKSNNETVGEIRRKVESELKGYTVTAMDILLFGPEPLNPGEVLSDYD